MVTLNGLHAGIYEIQSNPLIANYTGPTIFVYYNREDLCNKVTVLIPKMDIKLFAISVNSL